MLTRLRGTLFAGSGAVLLAIAVSGIVAASSVLTAAATPTAESDPAVVAAAIFEDLDGNGVDDACQEEVIPDAEAAAAAEAAADLDGDGTISVTEAAQSGRIAGLNCNHGGYVSGVANTDETCEAAEEDADADEATDEDTDTDEGDSELVASVVLVTETADGDEAACEEPAEETTEEDAPAPKAECEEPPPAEPVADEVEPLDESPNAHGKAVADVAKSDEVGGKNCNHGGAVSEAAKKDQEAAKAARDAAKAERDAARSERQAAREANHKAKTHGKKHGG